MTEEITKVEDELNDVMQELDHVRKVVWAFLEHQDVHEPGPFIKDGNYPLYTEKEKEQGVQICGDEDCGEYWPCSVEQLRREVFPSTAQLGSQEQHE